jgi:glyceraldehyde 3-phosphate dehydrogenase
VPHVLVSAPVKDASALNLVYGVNHDLWEGQHLVTAASCTTNCLAPVVAIIREAFGLQRGSFTTIHDVTNTQTIVDRAHKDPRRARSALTNLIPTTTGSAKAIMQIFPDLEGRLMGHAVRVPVLNGSLTDCAFELSRAVTVEEIHDAVRAAAEGPMEGIVGLEERPLVSSDYRGERRSAVVDALSTFVIGGTHLKMYVWYDNEFGYACRVADIARMIAAR